MGLGMAIYTLGYVFCMSVLSHLLPPLELISQMGVILHNGLYVGVFFLMGEGRR